MILALCLAVLAGALLPVQTGINLQLRTLLGQPLPAALVSFVIGTLGLGAMVAVMRTPAPVTAAWAGGHWWQWTGGLLGAVYVVATIVLAPRLGAATLVAAMVAGQMIASLALDQYGSLGFPVHPLSGVRLLGAAFVVAGVVLVRR